MQRINWNLLIFDNHKLIGNSKQIKNNGKGIKRYKEQFVRVAERKVMWNISAMVLSSIGFRFRCHLKDGNVIK